MGLLEGLEYNGRHLLYVPVGGDWADEYVYEGYVLHDQVLRAWALHLVAATYDEPAWRAKAALIG
ncbi:MAG: fructofuranosidase/invertase, partial [Gemmatimonadaceae bacterium]|nr:fructofuranosidase/invertase [Gemmatimonadaceae bacterium]